MNEELIHNSGNESRERGERLRRIRNLANLSRKDLCDEANVNINTYIGYEVGRYGGLTKNGANKIIDYIALKGVYTTFEWLMYGEGQAPRVETDIQQNCFLGNNAIDENKIILDEIFLFRKHYSNAIDYQIVDDGMSPFYDIGDYVAGVYEGFSSIDNLIGFNCILQIDSGGYIARNLRRGRKENYYTLSCTNPQTTVDHPIIYDVKLTFVAKIIWHRKIHLKGY